MKFAELGADAPAAVLDTFAAELYAALAPLAQQDGENGGALAYLTGAAGVPFQTLETYVRDTTSRPGWSSLMDPSVIPADGLPWLAQLAGVVLETGTPEAAARERIAALGGTKRGTPAALRSSVQATLTGDKVVVLVERDGGPYALTVATRTAETVDAAATVAAIEAAKPAGLVATHVVTDMRTFGEVEGIADDYADVEDTFTDYDDLLNP